MFHFPYLHFINATLITTFMYKSRRQSILNTVYIGMRSDY